MDEKRKGIDFPEVARRIRQVMDLKQMSQQDFAQALGISPASLSSILNGRTNPTFVHSAAIHEAFPEINIQWVMFGEGDMYADESMKSASMGSHAEGPKEGTLNYDMATGGNPYSVANTEAQGRDMNPLEAKDTTARNTMNRFQGENQLEYPMMGKIIRREVKEIRVFYDDGTYESFVPGK